MAYQKPQVTTCKLKDSEQASKLETVMGKLLHLVKSNYVVMWSADTLCSKFDPCSIPVRQVILCDLWPGATQGSPETGLT